MPASPSAGWQSLRTMGRFSVDNDSHLVEIQRTDLIQRGRSSCRWRTGLLALSVLAVATAACSDASGSPARTTGANSTTTAHSTTTTTQAEIPLPPGTPYRVGSETVNFVDHSRGTPANGSAPATPYRDLSTFVLYPAIGAPTPIPVASAPPASEGKPFPLIVFAHGLDSNGGIYRPLLQQWASAGFVVAAPTFPISNIAAPGGASAADLVAQPGDMSFVLTQVLALSRKSGNDLSGMIDPRRIAAVGHSLGAMTVLAWTEDTCCEDPRVDAAAIFDGTEADFGKGTFFGGHTVPLLVLHGTADQTIPYANGKAIYTGAKTPKFFISLIGAPHVSFLQLAPPGTKPPIWEHVDVQSVIDFLEGELDHNSASLRDLTALANDPGVSTLQQDP
jgi:dienelactone hydrolase